MGVNLRLFLTMAASMPKTIFFNIKAFPLKEAVRLPVMVHFNTRIDSLKKGCITIRDPVRFGIKIGFGGTRKIFPRRSYVDIGYGKVFFEKRALFGEGISLSNAGILHIGDNFFSNTNSTIWCSKEIAVGKDALLGWNVLLRDSDGHAMIENGIQKEISSPIKIGDHCWIASDSVVLKGSGFGNDCVLGYGSILTKHFDLNNTLFVGRPAKSVKNNINWIF